MEIIYAQGTATVAQVLERLPDPPSYSSVRALLAILEQKGHLKHEEEGGRYVYAPTRKRAHAGRSALHKVVQTFFDGSVEKAMAALLDSGDTKLPAQEGERLRKLINERRNA